MSPPHEAGQAPSLDMVKSTLVGVMRRAEAREGVMKRGTVIRLVLEQCPGAKKRQVQYIFDLCHKHINPGPRISKNPLASFGCVLRAADNPMYLGEYRLVQCEVPAPRI